MTTIYIPGQVIITVRATDADGIGTAFGMVEYRISSGAMQLGVPMFAILVPSVSPVGVHTYLHRLPTS